MIFPKVQWQDVGRTDEVEAGVLSPNRHIQIYTCLTMSWKCILFSKVSISAFNGRFNWLKQLEACLPSALFSYYCSPIFPVAEIFYRHFIEELHLIPALRLYRQALTLKYWHS